MPWWLAKTLLGCTSTPPEPPEAPVGAPSEVRFEVRTTGGREVFTEGEPIGLDLVFTSRVDGRYELSAATYDRVGRLHLDRFLVSPDAPDPLADRFDRGPESMGGIGHAATLGATPTVVTRDLAEYRRLSPGTYTLVVETDRVASDAGPLPLRAPPLSLTVVPGDPLALQHEAEQAAAVIDTSPDEEARRAAARTLRFLGTEAAAREMAARLSLRDPGSTNFELDFGLIGSPQRDLVISLLQDAIADPLRPIDVTFVYTLTLLRTKRDDPTALGPYPDGEAERARWQAAAAEQKARRDAVQRELLAMLAEATPHKAAAAKAICTETLQQLSWSAESASDPAALRAVLPDLPPERQQHLLDHYWLRFADPSLQGHLERLVTDPSTPDSLRNAALRRLLELAPAVGRAHVVDEIVREEPLLGEWALDLLRSLPDETLPEVDAVLGPRLTAPYVSDRDLYLIARYGTPALAAPVAARLAREGDAAGEGAFTASIAYLLRVQPVTGERLLRDGLGSADLRTRRARLLREIGALQPHPSLEAIAVPLLDDPDPNVAAEAANGLRTFGGPAAAAALWRRLQRFHDEWAPRAEELAPRGVSSGDDPNWPVVNLERALWEALGRADGFHLGPEQVDRLASLVVSPSGVDQVRFVAPSVPPQLSFHLSYGGALQIHVAQYEVRSLEALRTKLSQFPAGTTFALVHHGWGPPDREAALRAEIVALLHELGHAW